MSGEESPQETDDVAEENTEVDLLPLAAEYYKGAKMIAIIGPPKSGKTVVAALLYNAIIDHFLPANKNYRLEILKGSDFLQNTILSLKQGEFPDKTPESDINNVEMRLKQEVGTGGSIDIKLRDVAGEVYQDFYVHELPPEALLKNTLERDKVDKQFGEMSFLIFCKMYVILIDCADFSDWDRTSFENIKMINTIKAWKTANREFDKGKIKTPVAIMLTKSDLLDEENSEHSAEDLVKTRLAGFYQQLDSLVGNNKEFFKVYLNVKRGPNNQPTKVKGENYKVESPLSYSMEEYTKFISWIDSNMT
jgi:hypothetical protein